MIRILMGSRLRRIFTRMLASVLSASYTIHRTSTELDAAINLSVPNASFRLSDQIRTLPSTPNQTQMCFPAVARDQMMVSGSSYLNPPRAHSVSSQNLVLLIRRLHFGEESPMQPPILFILASPPPLCHQLRPSLQVTLRPIREDAALPRFPQTILVSSQRIRSAPTGPRNWQMREHMRPAGRLLLVLSMPPHIL